MVKNCLIQVNPALPDLLAWFRAQLESRSKRDIECELGLETAPRNDSAGAIDG